MSPAVDRLEVAGSPVGGREEPDREVRARAVQAESVEVAIRQALGVRLELGRARDPGLRRIVRVEPADVRDVLPEPLVRGLGLEFRVDELGPRWGGHGDDVPARRHAIDDLAGLREVREEIASGARRVEPRERARRVRTREGDARGVLVGEVEQALSHPRRDEVERVVGRVQDALALHPLVEVDDVDVLRAALVRGASDAARDVLLADVARDRDELAGLDVRAEDGELGELVLPRVDLAQGRDTLARMARCA